jgi:methionyl-tRNA formyltransferase
MKLVFFGTARFAVPALEAVKDSVSLVVSQPDRPSGRGMKLQPSPVKLRALELGLPVETPEKSRAPEFSERVRSEGADALLVAAYGQILSQSLLDSATHGGINLHGSLLPKYRGAAPIQRAVLNGETETGVTVMQMDKGMDTGDMIAFNRLTILPDETYGELETRLGSLGAEMAREWMPRIAAGEYQRQPQNHEAATMAPKVEKAEAELVTDRDALGEYNRFRAFTPSPGAFIRSRWGILKITTARLSPETGTPGTILVAGASVVIAFASGAIEVLELQPEGKKRMSGRDFANGMRLRPGMSLINE